MILLTGASGFLGRHIAHALLDAGYALRCLLREEGRLAPELRGRVSCVIGDLSDLGALDEAVEGAEAVVHAAARVSFDPADLPALRRDNAEGTARLVNACLAAGGPRFIHISSSSAIGRGKPGEPADEKTPWQAAQARNPYARTKQEAEKEVQRGIAEGLEAVILSPAIILGSSPDWSKGSPRLFDRAARGMAAVPAGRAGWVGAADVAKAVLLALETPAMSGQRYLLSAESLSYREAFGRIAAACGGRAPLLSLPPWAAIAAGWAAEQGLGLLRQPRFLTAELMRNVSGNFPLDGSKITRLGFRYTPLSEVIEACALDWRRDHPSRT